MLETATPALAAAARSTPSRPTPYCSTSLSLPTLFGFFPTGPAAESAEASRRVIKGTATWNSGSSSAAFSLSHWTTSISWSSRRASWVYCQPKCMSRPQKRTRRGAEAEKEGGGERGRGRVAAETVGIVIIVFVAIALSIASLADRITEWMRESLLLLRRRRAAAWSMQSSSGRKRIDLSEKEKVKKHFLTFLLAMASKSSPPSSTPLSPPSAQIHAAVDSDDPAVVGLGPVCAAAYAKLEV